MGKDLKRKELGKGISQRKDGYYVARNQKFHIELYSKDLRQLKKDFAVASAKCTVGLNEDGDRTVAEWFNEWFDTFKAPTVKPSSVHPMKQKVMSTFMPYIGDIRLTDLTIFDVQKAANSLLAEGKYARGSISEALNRLSDCLASAVNARIIPSNPAYDVRMPYKMEHEEYSERRWLSRTEIEKFLEMSANDWFHDCYYVMIYTGMRMGEVGGLKWPDIDFDKNLITLHQALRVDYESGKKKVYYSTLKTTNSYRVIPMIAGVREALIRQKERVETLKAELGDRFRAGEEFRDAVFFTSLGSVVSRHVLQHAINTLVDEINRSEMITAIREGREPVLFEKVYPHALRHTFASIAYQAGMDAKTTQKLMGHAHLSTTMDIYSHLDREYVAMDVSRISDYAEKIAASTLGS